MELSYRWKLSDLEKVEKNGAKVFSCFSCGGGSTMGYKLAGFDVVGNCEIDPATSVMYKRNNHPKYNFCCDIRDFAALGEYPEELNNLTILDGSPPCTTFSMAGKREDSWGKMKTFAEGNVKQRLDDLFFPFIDLACKLQPKVVVAENVKGLILKNARGYVSEIIKEFDRAGYKCQLFLLNAASAGVPQKRERVFFVCQRKDMNFPKLNLAFSERPVTFGEFRSEKGKKTSERVAAILSRRISTDKTIADINKRLCNKTSEFTNSIFHDNEVCRTLASSGTYYRYYDAMALSDMDCAHISSFPEDYDFGSKGAQFICGMSVPPLLMARIAHEIDVQWLRADK